MRLSEILSDARIDLELAADTKDEIIERLVDLVAAVEPGMDRGAVLKAVQTREKLMSTGVGNGVAIPHGKTNAVKSLVAAFGRCLHQVDFEALDGQPVRLVFLLVGPEDAAGPHIKALSRISRLLSYEEFRARLDQATSADEVLEAISEEERQYFERKN